MAAKPLGRLIIILVLIAAAAGIFHAIRSSLRAQGASDKDRFISTYVALSLAKERFQSRPDSLTAVHSHVYSKFGTDSAWMVDYAGKISGDVSRSERTWQEMTAKLDSLRRGSDPDSIFLN